MSEQNQNQPPEEPEGTEPPEPQFESIAPEEAEVHLPGAEGQPNGRLATEDDSEMPRDYDLTMEEILEIQNRTKTNSLFFCVCQLLILFMLSKLLLRIDQREQGLDSLKSLEEYFEQNEPEKFEGLKGSLRSIRLTWWYVQLNLYMYVLQIVFNFSNWFFVQYKQNQGINYSLRTNQVRYFKQNHHFKNIGKVFTFINLAFQFFGSFVVWNETATQASRENHSFADWWYLAHIMLMIRFSFYLSIVAAVVTFVLYEVCMYCVYEREQRRIETERQDRMPQVFTFLEQKKQPYIGRPGGADPENCAICLEEFVLNESEIVVLNCNEEKAKEEEKKAREEAVREVLAPDIESSGINHSTSLPPIGMSSLIELKERPASRDKSIGKNQILPQTTNILQANEVVEEESPAKSSIITLAPPTSASQNQPPAPESQPDEENRHIFHFECLKTWVQNNDVCPLCKRLVVKPEHES